MMVRIDLRSDTVTMPSAEMREAMYKAEVGDDVYGEDPTVNRLQELAAERLGTEAALFVASGTMGNLVALLTHCGRGQEAIVGDGCHIVLHEQGGPAALAGLFPRTIPNAADGTLSLEQLRAVLNLDPSDDHLATQKLICLENTWNGRVLKPAYVEQVGQFARQYKLKLHLDGARIFNAAVALKKPVRDIVKDFDSIQFCCSKGLAAPVGSLLCGSKEFIREAKRNRKLVGGGMRQAGVIAAACIIALESMVDRLNEDHQNAKLLAEGIASCPGLTINPAEVETNIVIFGFDDKLRTTPERVTELLAQKGLLVLPLDHRRIRAVTHFGIERKHIELAIQHVQSVVKSTQDLAVAGVSR